MRSKWIAAGVAAVLVGAGAGALSVRARRSAPAVSKPAAVGAAVSREVVLSGIVRPRNVVPVAPADKGMVEALPVEAGQVYQGEVLARVGTAGIEGARESAAEAVEQAQREVSRAEGRVIAARLETSRAGAAMERAQADLERGRKVYDRQKMLNDAGATPRLVYEKAEQDFQACQRDYAAAQKAVNAAVEETEAGNAALAGAKKELADRTAQAESAQLAYAASEVRSPVDGVLFAVHAELGKSWDGSGAMLEIATDVGDLEVVAEAPPDMLKRIQPGMAATVGLAGAADAGAPGVVREVKDNRVIVEFHGNTAALKIDMQASVRLKVE